jgi:hypothetical protein
VPEVGNCHNYRCENLKPAFKGYALTKEAESFRLFARIDSWQMLRIVSILAVFRDIMTPWASTIPEDSIIRCYRCENTKAYTVFLYGRLIISFDEAMSSRLYLHGKAQQWRYPVQEALFPVRRQVHPRCEPRGLRVFHLEDGGDIILRNVGSYKNHTASSYPRSQHSSLLPP